MPDPGSMVVKWVHLAAAGVLIGSLISLRFIVAPAMASLAPADRVAAWSAAFRNTLRWCSYSLLLLILTGLDNIMRARKTLVLMDASRAATYWSLFWAKMSLVGAAFVLIHLLLVRAPAFRRIQEGYRPWLGGLIAVVLGILFLSGVLTLSRLGLLKPM